MTITVFCILLFAALLHASWNAIVKASGDKMYAAISVSGSASLIAPVMLPFAPQPTLASAPYLVASCALQGGVYGTGGEDLSGVGYEPDLSANARHRAVAGRGYQRDISRRSLITAGPVGYWRHLPGDSGDGL